MFGDLVHYALQEFGRADDGIRHTKSEDVLLGYLNERLDALAAARFGEHLGRPAIRIQVEQARTRLRAFARWQAARSASGWLIAYSEDFNRKLSVPFEVDKEPLTLQGRIDRIDFHPKTGNYLILDYKTGDSANSPERAHRDGDGAWVDLQLPLYRHLLVDVKIDGATPVPWCDSESRDRCVQLGYINLPRDLSAVGLELAAWDVRLLAEADEVARGVVRRIRSETFWPPSRTPPAFCEDLAGICQDNLLAPWQEEGGEK
jgi:ATP-dependent helicase/nuclease subunit B